MSAFLALVRKDVRLFLSNRRALLVSLVAPVLIGAFMGAVLGGAPSKPVAVPIAVVDLDHSDISRQVLSAITKDSTFAVQQVTEAAAVDLVRKGRIRAAAVIPANFGGAATDALFRPDVGKPEVLLYFDPSQATALALIKGLLVQHVMQVVSAAVFGGDRGAALARLRASVAADSRLDVGTRNELLEMFTSIERVQQRGRGAAAADGASRPGLAVPYVTREHEVTSGQRPYNAYAHSFAGMGVQFILFMGVELGVGLLLMRRMGLWQRLRAAPISRATLLASRIMAGTIVALVLIAGIFGAAILIFGVRIEGSVPGFIAVAVAFAALTSSFGLLIAALGRTPEATRGIAIVLTLLLVMLGGAWVPTFIFPEWLQSVTNVVPTRWAIDGFDAMTWRGQGVDAVLLPVAGMLGLSAILAALAVYFFRWEE
jgi:ABC-2 type transport system permease protein